MSQQAQMNMAAMGGPVGGGATRMNVGTPSNSGVTDFSADTLVKKLNTAIYDYLLRNQLYDIAKSFQEQMPIDTKPDDKESPSQRGHQVNGVDDGMEDNRDQAILKRPEGLPLPNNLINGPFLQDWWCQFWEMWHGMRGRGKNGTQVYLNNQRAAQKGRYNMMGAVDPSMQNMRGNPMMQGMQNGMPMAQNDLRKSVMQQNNQQRQFTPAQMQQMKMQNTQQNQAMMQANAMERSSSQMDGSGPRSGSPGSGDGPSSPKRQRVEGGMQQMNQGRPGQPGQIQGNQSVEIYSNSIQQQMHAAMNTHMNKSNSNKGMNPNMGPGGAQGSPMNQAGMDGATGEFYANVNGRMPMQPNAAAAGQAGANNNGNHALQDYQMQLMLLEQQNKKRLLMARQEQDMANPAVGPNGQFAPGMSPQSSQRGADPSPNPNDMRGRGSPTPGMIDPNQIPPNMRAQMMMGPNGQQVMRPPSSHPAMAGMTPQQQVEAMRAQGVQIPNGQFPGGQPPQGQMMQGQQGAQGQPGQGQPMGTPRQQNNNMPPPPAPPATGGTQPSSPSSQQPPPTPNQNSKGKPAAKKEAAGKKGAANKKGGATATPATESEQPPTPTPATPATPMNANSFAHNKQNSQLPNGQPAAVAQANAANAAAQQQQQPTVAAPAAQPPSADMPFGALMDDNQFNSLGLDFGIENDLDNFDFDSFLNNDDAGGLGFDANFAFGDTEIELDGTN